MLLFVYILRQCNTYFRCQLSESFGKLVTPRNVEFQFLRQYDYSDPRRRSAARYARIPDWRVRSCGMS